MPDIIIKVDINDWRDVDWSDEERRNMILTTIAADAAYQMNATAERYDVVVGVRAVFKGDE